MTYDLENFAENQDYLIRYDYFSIVCPLVYFDILDKESTMINELHAICDLINYKYSDIYPVENRINGFEKCYKIGEFINVRFGGYSTRIKLKDDLDDEHLATTYVDSFQFELKGKGCREIDKQLVSWETLFYYFKIIKKGNCRRLDIAIDDLKGDLITIPLIKEKIDKGYYVSSFRKLPVYMGNKESGESINFGSHSSTLMLCIYDKMSERKVMGDTFDGDFWTRYEMRFAYDKADLVLKNIIDYETADTIGLYSKQWLYTMLVLKEDNNYDSNHQYQADDYKPWVDFVSTIEKISLCSNSLMDSTIDRKLAWFKYSVSSTMTSFILSGLSQHYDNYDNKALGLYAILLCDVLEKIKDKKYLNRNLAMINNFRENNAMPKITDKSDLEDEIKEIQKALDELEKTKLPF